MRPRGDLRHHAAERRVLAFLAQNRVGQHPPLAVQHGRGGLVTRGFQAKDRQHPYNP